MVDKLKISKSEKDFYTQVFKKLTNSVCLNEDSLIKFATKKANIPQNIAI